MKKYILILFTVFLFGCDIKIDPHQDKKQNTIQEHNSIGDPSKRRPNVYCNEFGAMYYRYGDTLTPMFNKHSEIVTCDEYLIKANKK